MSGAFPELQLTQRLHRGDRTKQLRFCRWILDKWGSPSFRRSLLFKDEAHFFNGQVHKQNFRVWGNKNPTRSWSETSIHLMLPCGVVCLHGGHWPLFLSGKAVTVTGPPYKGKTDGFFVPALRRRHIPPRGIWFQQDTPLLLAPEEC